MLLKQKGFIDPAPLLGAFIIAAVILVLLGTAVGAALMKWLS